MSLRRAYGLGNKAMAVETGVHARTVGLVGGGEPIEVERRGMPDMLRGDEPRTILWDDEAGTHSRRPNRL